MWTIEQGDSLARMTRLADGSIDAIITDPPYSSGGAFRSDRAGPANEKYAAGKQLDRLPEFFGDSRTERGLLLWSALWLGECWRVARAGAAIAVFTDWRSYPTMSDALQAGGWSWRGVGVWIKPPGRSRPISGGLWNDTEFVLWGSKGPRSGECLPGTWTVAAPRSDLRLHATEKPQAVLADLVRLAPAGGVVLDPFTGSGSTGVAAITAGRRFIGYELSPDYAAIATDRLRALDAHGADVSYHGNGPTLFEGA